MPRFHFNIYDGFPILDPDGVEFKTVSSARQHALAIGRTLEIARMTPEMSRVQFVCVHTRNGRLLFTVAINTFIPPLARSVALAEMRIARQEAIVARLDYTGAHNVSLAWEMLVLLRDSLARLVVRHQAEVRRLAAGPAIGASDTPLLPLRL